MTIYHQLQHDLRAAMRAQDRRRVSVIRLILNAFEKAQEAMGKQAYEQADAGISALSAILPDRHQPLTRAAVEEILHSEIRHRREAADLLPTAGHPARAELEAEMELLHHYLRAAAE